MVLFKEMWGKSHVHFNGDWNGRLQNQKELSLDNNHRAQGQKGTRVFV